MESSRGVIGVDGSSFTVEEPDVESWAVVLPDEYEVERGGVSRNGSLGALARLGKVVDIIGGDFWGCGGAEGCWEGSGWDCDRECTRETVGKGEPSAELDLLEERSSSKPRTYSTRCKNTVENGMIENYLLL